MTFFVGLIPHNTCQCLFNQQLKIVKEKKDVWIESNDCLEAVVYIKQWTGWQLAFDKNTHQDNVQPSFCGSTSAIRSCQKR